MTLTRVDCSETMRSKARPEHIHTCNGHHDPQGGHFCPACRIWWWRQWRTSEDN